MKTKLLVLTLFVLQTCLFLDFTGCGGGIFSGRRIVVNKLPKNICDTIGIARPKGINLNAVSFTNPHEGVIVGDKGLILTTTNGGRDWKITGSIAGTNLHGVTASDSRSFISVGERGKILRSRTSGITWDSIVSNNAHFKKSLRSAAFYSDHNGYAVGDSGVIFATNDTGDSWKKVHGDPSITFTGISYNSRNTPYVVGTNGSIFFSTDNGATWMAGTSNTTQNLKSIHFSLGKNLYEHSDIGFIVGDAGTVLKTNDGGNNWNIDSSGLLTGKNLRSVFLTSSHWGYAVGEAGTVLRYNGSKWELLPQATSNNLNGVDPWWSYTSICVGEHGEILSYNPPLVTNGSEVTPSSLDGIFWTVDLNLAGITEPNSDVVYTHFELCVNSDLDWRPRSILSGWAVYDQFYGRSIQLSQAQPTHQWQIAFLDPGGHTSERIMSCYFMDASGNPYLLSSYLLSLPEGNY